MTPGTCAIPQARRVRTDRAADVLGAAILLQMIAAVAARAEEQRAPVLRRRHLADLHHAVDEHVDALGEVVDHVVIRAKSVRMTLKGCKDGGDEDVDDIVASRVQIVGDDTVVLRQVLQADVLSFRRLDTHVFGERLGVQDLDDGTQI